MKDLRQMHQKLGAVVIWKEGDGGCNMFYGSIFCIGKVTMAWEGTRLQIRMVEQVPARRLVHTRTCLPRNNNQGHWEEYRNGHWEMTSEGGRCCTIIMEKVIRVICREEMSVRDVMGRVHILGPDYQDVELDTLPVQSVDMTWVLGRKGVVLDNREHWMGQMRIGWRHPGEVDTLEIPAEEMEKDKVVVGTLSFGRVLLVFVLGSCVLWWCWRKKAAGMHASADRYPLGDVEIFEEVRVGDGFQLAISRSPRIRQ